MKKSKASKTINKVGVSTPIKQNVLTIIGLVYAFSVITNAIYATSVLVNGGTFDSFVLPDIIMPALLPGILFGIGYLVLKNNSKIVRAFNSALFAISCFLLSTISHFVYWAINMDVDIFNWLQSDLVSAIVVALSFVIFYIFFRQHKQDQVPNSFKIYFIALTLVTFATHLLLTISYGPGLMYWYWIMYDFVQVVLSVLYIGVGYLLLSNIKLPMQRLFLACIGAVIAYVTYGAFLPICSIMSDSQTSFIYIMAIGYVVAIIMYLVSIFIFKKSIR